MPHEDFVVQDSTNNKYVSAYTSPSSYSETFDLGLVPIRTEAQCNAIRDDLNAVYGAGKFGTHVRPH